MALSLQAEMTPAGLGILSSGKHKFDAIAPRLKDCGVSPVRHIQVEPDLIEPQTSSPRSVLPGKLAEFVSVAGDTKSWMTEWEMGISAVAVLDVLGLMLQPNQPFSDAAEMVGKPEVDNQFDAAAEFFSRLLAQSTYDGKLWLGLVPCASTAPLDKNGYVRLEKAKHRWDNPTLLGFSVPLVHMLSVSHNVAELTAAGVISPHSTSVRSNGGIKSNLLARDVAKIATWRKNDGLSMEVRQGKKSWLLDSKCDRASFPEIFELVDAVGDNATMSLAMQIARDVRMFSKKP